jgi:DNA polymerase-3 subunit gamma/tau
MAATLEIPDPGTPEAPTGPPGGPDIPPDPTPPEQPAETPPAPEVPDPEPPVEPEPGEPNVPSPDPTGPEIPDEPQPPEPEPDYEPPGVSRADLNRDQMTDETPKRPTSCPPEEGPAEQVPDDVEQAGEGAARELSSDQSQ